MFSADETCDIGAESGSPVSCDYTTREINGEVNWAAEIDVAEVAEDEDHHMAREERFAIAMGIQ